MDTLVDTLQRPGGNMAVQASGMEQHTLNLRKSLQAGIAVRAGIYLSGFESGR
ncbi:MAG: hypothetical protein ACREX0_18055 [Noviherbaspirillum sp.]